MKVKFKKEEKSVFDFGMFPGGDGEISVQKEEWDEYVSLRTKFEFAHANLIEKAKRKVKV